MDAVITVTKSDLERAFRAWGEKAKAENWPERDDADVPQEQATYLFALLTGNQA